MVGLVVPMSLFSSKLQAFKPMPTQPSPSTGHHMMLSWRTSRMQVENSAPWEFSLEGSLPFASEI